uniref:RING-type E3 ubiquitin transferase n=1 Tax=Aceria tosichella TaxID=561515 RepID=A0A6G1SNF8_9ACAR
MDKPLSRSGLYTVAEKDQQYHRLWVEDSLQEITQRCIGVRRWVQYRSAITVLSRFGYFGINSFLGRSTPGEEFCDAKLSDCSPIQRLFMILLNNDLKLPSDVPKRFAEMVKDVHLITFYLFGDFYELSKRATGISYIKRDPAITEEIPKSFELLNKLIGVISVVKLILNYQRDIERQQEDTNSLTRTTTLKDSLENKNSDILCQLCSGPRNEATSALCGHIFCWSCIHNWLKERNECPICRMPTEPSRLIHLVNFR